MRGTQPAPLSLTKSWDTVYLLELCNEQELYDVNSEALGQELEKDEEDTEDEAAMKDNDEL